MTSGDERGFNLLTARWLALGAAAGATLSLLAAQLGVQGPRVESASYGKERLADQDTNEAAHQRNRRVEFEYR